jgi:hypothetical protein
MSPIAHGLSASLVAVTFARVSPTETPYIAVALISATVIDLDHLVYVIRDRAMYRRVGYAGQLHHARSPLHELVGLLIFGVLCALFFFVDPKLVRVIFIACTVHLAQDWVLGESHPLAPFDNTSIQFFALTLKQKVLIDVIVVLLSSVLWMIYLAVPA